MSSRLVLLLAASLVVVACGKRGPAGRAEGDELGVSVPPGAASALGAYARTRRTPVNRGATTDLDGDAGVRVPKRVAKPLDGGVPL